MIRAHLAFPIRFHLAMFGTRRTSNKAGIDTLGLPEAAVMATSPIAAVPEHQRSRDRSAPFVAVPAAVHPEHAHAMPHPPAIRTVVPRTVDVDGVVVEFGIVRDVVGRID